jgi:hypothetical protein
MEDNSLVKWIFSTTITAMVLYAMTVVAQNATDVCRLTPVIPLAGASEPPAKTVIDPPLAGPLASRGVAIIHLPRFTYPKQSRTRWVRPFTL